MTPTCIWMYLAGVATGIALVCMVVSLWLIVDGVRNLKEGREKLRWLSEQDQNGGRQ